MQADTAAVPVHSGGHIMEPPKLPTKLFVGNISRDTTEPDLRALFGQYGHIAECVIMSDYGFVVC